MFIDRECKVNTKRALHLICKLATTEVESTINYQAREQGREALEIVRSIFTAEQLIDEIAPKHSRTSCSDELLQNAYHGEHGCSDCVRCALLHRLRKDEWLHGRSHTVDSMDLHLPNWRHTRNILNDLPVRHEAWRY